MKQRFLTKPHAHGRPWFWLLIIILASGLWPGRPATTSAQQRELSTADRVACQTAIEEVYWLHREWPAVNPTPKPAFSAAISPEQVAGKVDNTVRLSNALAELWQSPVTGEMLQAEMERQASATKDPQMLRQLWAALNNDPLLIAECLARPALADRLVQSWQAQDGRFAGRPFESWWSSVAGSMSSELEQPVFAYTLPAPPTGSRGAIEGADDLWDDTPAIPLGTTGVSVWTGVEMIFYGSSSTQGHRYNPATDTWKTMTTQNAPHRVRDFTAVWSGTEMITFGGCTGSLEFCTTNGGGRYNPLTDTWTPTSTAGAPDPRRHHGAVWSGTEMIVWGGCRENAVGNQNCNIVMNSGGRYSPATDSWQATSTVNAPAERNQPDLLWAGDRMVLWSGAASADPGGRYDPASNSWSDISTVNAPTGLGAALVWTGSEMLAWGGCTGAPFCDTAFGDGGRYLPASDSWTPMSSAGGPSARWAHDAVWTGDEMLVWGGTSGGATFLNTGGRYDPASDSWSGVTTTGAPAGRHSMKLHWTGDLLLIWGGIGPDNSARSGARYNPASNSWTPISASDPNSFRYFHTAIWTGTEMLAWGGEGDGTASTGLNTGRRYDPALDSWGMMTTTGAPTPRDSHSAIWTGVEMIIWGGDVFSSSSPGSGGRYNPASDSWTATALSGAPVGRANHTAVWTGTEMIVWGGSIWDTPWDNHGGRYSPASNSWSPVSTTGAPSGRYLHSGVWTGSEMLIWGGAGSTGPLGNGARYNPGSNSWSPISNTNAPEQRTVHATVWTGTEMIVWGGASDYSPWINLNSGGRYNPASDTWTSTSLSGAPAPRARLASVWTGEELIVWSGCTSSTCLLGDASGGRYNPQSDSWIATTTIGAPEARQFPSAVWTGEAMLVWGGNTDDNGITNTGGLYYAEAPPNSAPLAVNDDYVLDEGETLVVAAPGVLGNDSDPDGNPLSAQLEQGPDNGMLTLNLNGSFSYAPDAGFAGADSFTYRAYDGAAVSNIATVSLLVQEVNNAPLAADDAYELMKDTTLTVDAPGVLTNDSDPDGDPLSATLESDPTHGSLSLSPDGAFSYTPDPGYAGQDSFTYRAGDGELNSDVAEVTLEVVAENAAPSAVDDAYDVDEDGLLAVDPPGVLANDSDPDGDSLTVELVSGPTSGALTLNGDGSFSYEPNENYHGTDGFTYRATDGLADSNVATVALTIAAVNDAPAAVDDSYEMDMGQTLNVSAPGVLANDSDLDGDSLSALLNEGPDNGDLILYPDGSFSYTPDAGFSGIDSFTYLVSDGKGGNAQATVTITVNEIGTDVRLIFLPIAVSRP